MANRFWVGGTGNWNTTTTHWSATSGGASGASAPGVADDVFFDANSGGGTVAMLGDGSNTCRSKSVDTTGFTGTINGNAGASTWLVEGTVFKLAAGTLTAAAALQVKMQGGTAKLLTTAGNQLPSLWVATGSVTQQDNLTLGGFFQTESGASFDANGHDFAMTSLSSLNINASSTVTLGSGIWSVPGWFVPGAATCIIPGTATIKIVQDSGVFNGGAITYERIWAAAGFHTTTYFTGAVNNCNTLKADAGVYLAFDDGSTTTFGTADFTTPAIIQSINSVSAHNLVCVSGAVAVSGCAISNSHASGGATFTAASSFDGGGNTGWDFGSAGTRYWVGGNATWDGTAGSKWAASSGGAGGHTVPTSANPVVLDANSGASTVTVSGSRDCASLSCGGFTGTLTRSLPGSLNVYGSLTLSAGMTLGAGVGFAMQGAGTITHAGHDLNDLDVDAGAVAVTTGFSLSGTLNVRNAATLTMQGDFTIATALNVDDTATFDTGGNYYAHVGELSLAAGATLHLGDNEWDICVGSGGLCSLLGALDGNAYIYFQGSPSAPVSVVMAGQTIANEMDFDGMGGGTLGFQFSGTAVMGDFEVYSGPVTVQFANGSEIDATTMDFFGFLGGELTLEALSGSWSLVCPSGVVNASYSTIQGSQASGGASFIATDNCVDAGGNTGWDFGVPPAAPFVPGLFFGNPF